MIIFEFGTVILILILIPFPFPFTNQLDSKKRPAVVISSKLYNQTKSDLIVMAITSQIRINTELDTMIIKDWQVAGLLKESMVKPIIFTIEKSLIRKTLGHLGQTDKKNLKRTMTLILGEKFN